MPLLLDQDEVSLKAHGAYWTTREICQQPRLWREAAEQIEEHRAALNGFMQPVLKDDQLRIILTGAGTSAYIGEAIAPHLTERLQRPVEAISTTDLVSNAPQYLLADRPTLLVSFGRSGNSPESVAAYNLANQLVPNCYHLVITCNRESELALSAKNRDNTYSLIMPEGSLDQGFAMTSSFTSMVVSTLHIFSPEPEQLFFASLWAETFIERGMQSMQEQAAEPVSRIVFLGAGGLLGYAREAALKVLELTAGQVMSYSESPLGFRHGPKSLVTPETEIVLFASSDGYTSLYDMDLLDELKRDNRASRITLLDHQTFRQPQPIGDVWAGLAYIVYCQTYALLKSLNKGITPDNPCPTGEVNRVVQGVTLYPLVQAG